MAKRNKRQRIADRQKKIDDRALQLNVDANLSTTDESDSAKMKKKAGKLEKRSKKLEGKLDPSVARENTRKKLVEKRDKKINKIEKRFPEPTKKFDKKEKKINKAKGKFYDKLDDADDVRKDAEQDILDSRASFNQKQEALSLKTKEKAQKDLEKQQNKGQRTINQLIKGGERIAKKHKKGKQVGKFLKKRAIKKAIEITGSDLAGEIVESVIDSDNNKVEALNQKNKNEMFQMGSAMGGGAPSIDTEGMTGTQKAQVARAQIASDLEYFKMANPVLQPTDYYPQMNRSIAVGTSSGEIIGSRTIYTGAGVLAPMTLYDSRKRALAAATRAGIANAQGDMTKLPQVRKQYIDRYNDYANDVMNEIMSDKEYFKNGQLTGAGRQKLQEAVQTGNTINSALASADRYQEHLLKLKESGKGEMTGIDDVYFDPDMIKFTRELLKGETDFNDFKDMKILERIASGEGLEYRNAQKDFQSEILPRLQNEAAMDQKNLMDNKYQGAEGSDPSDFIDKNSGLLTQAYMKTVANERIRDAVEAFYDANEGMYSPKQKEDLIRLAQAQIGERETIKTTQQSMGSGGASSRNAQFNTYFDGTTRGLRTKSLPAVDNLVSGSTDEDITDILLTTVGGYGGTTAMMRAQDGNPVPVTRTALPTEGAKMPIGLGSISNNFAVEVNGTYAELSGTEVEAAIRANKNVTAYGTGSVCQLEWFKAYNDISKLPTGTMYCRASEDVNALGYVSGGQVVALNEGSLDGFQNASQDSKVQLKSMLYTPYIDRAVMLEKGNAMNNYQSVVKQIESSGGAYLVSRSPMVIPFNNSQQINTNLSNAQSQDNTSDKNLER